MFAMATDPPSKVASDEGLFYLGPDAAWRTVGALTTSKKAMSCSIRTVTENSVAMLVRNFFVQGKPNEEVYFAVTISGFFKEVSPGPYSPRNVVPGKVIFSSASGETTSSSAQFYVYNDDYLVIPDLSPKFTAFFGASASMRIQLETGHYINFKLNGTSTELKHLLQCVKDGSTLIAESWKTTN